MSEEPESQTRHALTAPRSIALGAGAGMILGAVFGNIGAGMVLGAALGLVFPGVIEWVRRKDSGAG